MGHLLLDGLLWGEVEMMIVLIKLIMHEERKENGLEVDNATIALRQRLMIVQAVRIPLSLPLLF